VEAETGLYQTILEIVPVEAHMIRLAEPHAPFGLRNLSRRLRPAGVMRLR
jgi:hypothetical protein